MDPPASHRSPGPRGPLALSLGQVAPPHPAGIKAGLLHQIGEQRNIAAGSGDPFAEPRPVRGILRALTGPEITVPHQATITFLSRRSLWLGIRWHPLVNKCAIWLMCPLHSTVNKCFM